MDAIADSIRHARAAAGLSQRALAERAGVPHATVARIEAGHVEPTLATLRRLLAAAGVELRLTTAPRAAADPVVEAYKAGIDRSLVRANLARTVDQRLRMLADMQRLDAELARSAGARSPAKRRVAPRRR